MRTLVVEFSIPIAFSLDLVWGSCFEASRKVLRMAELIISGVRLSKLWVVRPNKKYVLFTVTCPIKVGSVGREFFLFYLFIFY